MKPKSERPIIKNYRSGRLWWGCEHLAYHEINTSEHVYLEKTENIDDRFKQVCDWLNDNEFTELTIEAYFCVGEDNEVMTMECDLDEVFYPEEFDEAIDSCPFLMDEEKEKSKIDMQEYCDNLEKEQFKFYEPDE